MGRHIDNNGAVKFGSSRVTFFMKFSSTHLTVKIEDEFWESTRYNWFTVVIDCTKPFRFRIRPDKTTYTLALSKAMEGSIGHNQLVCIYTTKLLNPAPLPKRKNRIIGDSITAGYGLDTRNLNWAESRWFDPTYAWYAYGPRVARHFNTQWMNSAVSDWNASQFKFGFLDDAQHV